MVGLSIGREQPGQKKKMYHANQQQKKEKKKELFPGYDTTFLQLWWVKSI